jgi:ubiquinol-cytochrome c reductase cytochrome b subunit
MLIGFVALHLLLVLKLGINDWPMPGRIVHRSTYLKEYHELTHKSGIPFVPQAIWKDMFFSATIIVSVMLCAAIFGPFGPTGVPDPTIVQTVPRPDLPFLWLYALLSLLPPGMETSVMLIGPVLAIAFLIWLPFLSGEGEKSWLRRPVAVVTLALIAVSLATLTQLANYAPWSPVMNAWSGDPVPVGMLHGRTPLERQGALVFQGKQCRNCHSIGGAGGKRGPALDTVGTTLTHDQLVRQVIQGGGNMPAFGKNLTPAETTALVSFLQTLRPPGRPPAKNASQSAVMQQEGSRNSAANGR